MYSNVDIDRGFEGLPPFPEDVLTAPLRRVSLQKLLDSDLEECQRLWDACTKLGFFYLDLNTSDHGSHTHGSCDVAGDDSNCERIEGKRFADDAERLFSVGKEFFALATEEKSSYDLSGQGSYFGYKGYGAGFVDKEGNRDRNEFYNVSKDDILGMSERLPQPQLFDAYRPLLTSYMTNAHSIVSVILARLNEKLGLSTAPVPVLSGLHRRSSISGDQVRFIRAPPQPMDDRQASLGAHTDFGSVTLLFNRLGGLQVLPPPELTNEHGESYTDWLYVKPLPGHCIVNLGDAMVKFSGGILKSATHRVVNPPGEEQGKLVRHSLVYFARPADEVMLRVLRGQGSKMIDAAAAERESRGEVDEEITAKDWILRRALGRRGKAGYSMKDADGTEVKGKD
ncbi:MAG: hypothetical protein Q9162_001996 [Coniocarpon cinnabarinum]